MAPAAPLRSHRAPQRRRLSPDVAGLEAGIPPSTPRPCSTTPRPASGMAPAANGLHVADQRRRRVVAVLVVGAVLAQSSGGLVLAPTAARAPRVGRPPSRLPLGGSP